MTARGATPAGDASHVRERLLDTPHGPARLLTHEPRGGLRVGAAPVRDSAAAVPGARSEVLLSHGAGGGVEARDLVALATVLPAAGHRVHLLEQPWRVAGRKIATAPPTLDEALLAALAVVEAERAGQTPVVLGGRSAGARSACRCAALPLAREQGVVGVLAQSFPLHPPGKPEKSRLAELEGVGAAGLPVLVLQGERDAMGQPEEFPAHLALHVVPAADHGLKVLKRAPVSEAQAMAELAGAAAQWLDALVGVPGTR